MSSKAKREVAKRERERLRLQEKLKKEQLEKMRQEQNEDASAGEVTPGANNWSRHSSGQPRVADDLL